ncbi:helix-turn-helix domain-containing protein [Nocardia brasiliensis]|uniref:DNA binding regulatory protein n=1 Tax=Nocardia brasiliensis (strain ATCC 700358 / HUJEG-1) TaxID=1133849 RepID=K0F3Z4_NOCB7|nr:helix-turn-helix domain-containing protein [Nocardia brasiliensis]AFU02286.1 DNA binding regulatory protein [Nocardia brasiliensis ATCC 700358]AHK61112.1 NobF [Nocardia brasiliensis ATCC 700358]
MSDLADSTKLDSAAAAIGAQIRRMREARGMSAAELARQSGISKATLSTLESGAGNPRIDTLSAIAVALRLPLGDLIVATAPSRATLRPGTSEPDYSKQELLQRVGAGVYVEVWRIRIRKAGNRIDSPAHTVGTVEHLHVAKGGLRVGAVDTPCDAAAGDFVVFGADVPHFYEATTDNVEAVLVMTYPVSGW